MAPIEAVTRMPIECVDLVEGVVRSAVLFGMNGGGIHTDEYGALLRSRKWLYEYLDDRLDWSSTELETDLRFL